MTGGAPPGPEPAVADAAVAASFVRRQLVVTSVAGAVVLAAVVMVAAVVPDARGPSHASLRMAADGRVIPVSPLAESSRSALWASGVALLAVAVVLTLVLDHTWRVARYTVRRRPRSAATGGHDGVEGDAHHQETPDPCP